VIYYDYTISGRKVQEENRVDGIYTGMRYYAGPFVFTILDTVPPAWVNTPYGRFVRNGTTWTHEFHMKDHLGNTRLAMLASGGTTQENSYYPFGMRISTLSSEPLNLGNVKNRYTYNGKEFNSDFGLNWHDYGARMYDAQIGRWHSVDPLAEKYYSISPYAYVANNPIIFIDPDGRYIEYYDNEAKRWRRLDPSSSRQPTDEFGKSLYQVYMLFSQKEGAGENFMNALFSSDYTIRVETTDFDSEYHPASERVIWNPLQGLHTDNDVILSPATILEHEMAHAVRHKIDFDGFKADSHPSTRTTEWRDKEEERVVRGPEQRTAEALGEVRPGQLTRKTYGNYSNTKPVITTNPTSTKIDSSKTRLFRQRRNNRPFNVEP
jgi:RHS repeat-associated protein